MNDNRVKLDPLINQLVRFKLHEAAELFEATIIAFDDTGYWVRGGSLCAYLKQSASSAIEESDTGFIEFTRIHSIQKVAT